MARGMKEIKPQIKSEEAIPLRMALASTTKLATRSLLWLCRKHDKNARLWLGDSGITPNWHLGTAECYRPECLSNLCGVRSAREYCRLQEVQSRACLPRGAHSQLATREAKLDSSDGILPSFGSTSVATDRFSSNGL